MAVLTLLAGITAAAAQGDPQAAVTNEIAKLERLVAQQAAAARTATSDPAKEMQVLLSMAQLAGLYAKANRIESSWPLMDTILERIEKLFGPDSPNIVDQLEANAASFGLRGRYADAEKLRKRAIAINERVFGPDSLNVAVSLQGMAGLFRQQDRNDEALVYAERARTIADRKPPTTAIQRASFISQVADIHMSMKRYDLAEPLLRQALAIVEAAKDADATVAGALTIQYLQSLALADFWRGLYPQAQALIDRAIATSNRLLGPNHPMTGAMLMTLGLQLLEREQLDAAERMFQQALPISEQNSKLGAIVADNYVGLGLVAFKRRNWEAAYTHLRKASVISIELDKIATAGGIAPAPGRIGSRADIFLLHAAAAYRAAEMKPDGADALRDDAFRMAQHAERSSVGGALAQMAARVAASDASIAALVRERQDLGLEWRRLDGELEKGLASPAAQRNAAEERHARARMTVISSRLDAIDARVAKEFPNFAKLSDPAPLAIAEVQSLLQPGEVMIYAGHRPNQSLVWAIGRDKVMWDLVPFGEEELGPMVARLRCGLDEAAWQGEGAKTCASLTGQSWQPLQAGRPGQLLPFDLAQAHELFKAILGPFATMTENASLIVATSGPLAVLPLHALVTAPPAAALPTEADGYRNAAWLARRNAITVLPSVSSLQALRAIAKPSQASRPFFAVANPVLDGPDARYRELAGAARARTACTAAAQPQAAVAVVRGAGARRASLSAAARRGLAPLDVLRAQSPLPETADEVCAVARDFGAGDADIRLAARATETEIKRLSANGELSQYRIVHFATHGVLAGQISATAEPGFILTPPAAATAGDDGFLSASEIAGLKLDADWVILSACNTAGATKTGAEALSGLSRAFFHAQARALLVSHWEVDSGATVKLITSAVGAIAQDKSIGRAEALRGAMRAMIEKGQPHEAHPAYWAPFVVVGEGAATR